MLYIIFFLPSSLVIWALAVINNCMVHFAVILLKCLVGKVILLLIIYLSFKFLYFGFNFTVTHSVLPQKNHYLQIHLTPLYSNIFLKQAMASTLLHNLKPQDLLACIEVQVSRKWEFHRNTDIGSILHIGMVLADKEVRIHCFSFFIILHTNNQL